MSGPKAFRIVTRAEVLAICRRDLARLDAAVEAWASAGRRNGTIEKKDLDAVMARRDGLRRLLDADRFVELQKQVSSEISFLQADAETRIRKASEMAARAQRDLRRTRAAAGALLRKLHDANVAIPADIADILADHRNAAERVDAVMARALALLPGPPAQRVGSDRRHELAAKLEVGERRTTVQDWVSAQPPTETDPVLVRIDDLIGEMRGLGMDTGPFATRVAEIEAAVPARRALIADSLLLDLATAVRNARVRDRLTGDLRERRAELSSGGSAEAAALVAEIDALLADPAAEGGPDLLRRSTAAIEDELKAMAAAERRHVMLQGLASLGYEVTEGMATAWVEGGQVVLRKPANPGYGVELSGGSRSDLLQVRAVGIGSGTEARDFRRDRDMEEIWCGEFARLQTLIAKAGGNIAIESARPVGQFPLKVVADPAAPVDVDTVESKRL